MTSSRQISRLDDMADTTTIRLTVEAREELRRLAEESGRTMTDELQVLVRAERQRRMGAALAEPPSDDDDLWVAMAADEVRRAAR